VSTVFLQADAILRARPTPLRGAWSARGLGDLVLLVLIFGLFYGAVMGSFGGIVGERALQVLYSALKVPMLLLVTFLISLPSFFVINTLMGLRQDFAQATGALISAQAGLTIILASLSPMTALWYASTPDYHSAVVFNGVMFAVASLGAQTILRRLYRPLIARNSRHRTLLRLWVIIYTFVAVQMAWVLRPFVGDPGSPTSFFRPEAWGNAWEVIGRLIWDVLF
jgi:hypothetical protein